jgi:pimeloyl-ACP methyl ester carboxylesterase
MPYFFEKFFTRNLNAMQPNIPLTTVDVMDQCGHFPWIEQPNRFYSTLARTLK